MNTKIVGTFAGLLLLVGCGGGDPAVTSVAFTPNTIQAGDEGTLTVEVENFTLREPGPEPGEALHAAEETEAGKSGDYPDGGHFHVYLDSVEENPIPLNCPDYCEHPGFTPTNKLRIPATTTAGSHTIIVRLNNDDHTFLNPPIQNTAMITVTSTI